MTQRHELVDECVNTKHLQYRLALKALRMAEAERMKHRKRAAWASLEEVVPALKAGLADLLSDDSEAALQA